MARAWFEDLPTELRLPDESDDLQELWELKGRADALHNLIKWKKAHNYSMSLGEAESVMGWDDLHCRRNGHPASED